MKRQIATESEIDECMELIIEELRFAQRKFPNWPQDIIHGMIDIDCSEEYSGQYNQIQQFRQALCCKVFEDYLQEKDSKPIRILNCKTSVMLVR